MSEIPDALPDSSHTVEQKFQTWWMTGAYGRRPYDRFDALGVTEEEAFEIWKAALGYEA